MKKIFLLPLAFLAFACGDDDSNVAPIEPVSGGTIFGTAEHPLNVGGPTQQNQVYVDLSGESTTNVARDSWDLGFYSGDDFRVVINGSLRMAVKQLETTDISLVQEEDQMVAVGTFDAANMAYIDHPNGSLSQTAFGTIASSEAAAKVYLVNMGSQIPTNTVEPGTSNVAGDPRGWKKVKVWRDGSGYKVQYANLEATTATEVAITKNAAYNHVFFSLATGTTVQAEPEKDKWDMNFTTFTNEVFMGTVSSGAYFYSDYIVTNTKAGVTALMIEGDSAAYEAFSLQALETGDFAFSTDQRAIGANWRSVLPVQVYNDVFFVLQDRDGNYYKIKFLSMLSTGGHRGFPVFQYALLQ
ncbi:HmuY family protein [uncultured Flavobacterium sp.]|uniref:HmuY family protein n=1 Tax=uncultured Flavobacterium sp. TaxID=165435 RepID=UPI0025CF0771|nr:HmuY family protein [uncultured Flavobacterium sp.]